MRSAQAVSQAAIQATIQVAIVRPPAESEAAWMRRALHDLCQPLTALECRLYLATMPELDGTRPTAAELAEAVQDGLRQCDRLMAKVRVMQDRLQSAEGAA